MKILRVFFSFARTVSFVVSFTAVQIVALVCAPVTFLNPFLRRIGITESKLPMNIVLPLLARWVLFMSGVKLQVTDHASKEADTQIIYMYNHTSNLDPVIVQSVASCKFVFKKELKYVPLFGWVMYVYRHISIDRKRREQAIESLNRAVKKVVEKHQNVAISPEGTRSKSGQLMEFKKGPFHLAIQAKCKIVPVVISGAHSILPPKSFLLRGGRVAVTLLPPIQMKGDEDVDELRVRLHQVFADELAKQRKLEQPSEVATALPGLTLLGTVPMWLSGKLSL